jgi:N6-adenosine-specific RNA methylase IME4
MKKINQSYKDYILQMEDKDSCIIDPPWNYDDKPERLLRKQLSYNLWIDNNKELEFLFENIKCNYIFMWTTNAFIYNLMRCNHFNFNYKCLITWIKLTSKGNEMFGLGNSFRNCTEQLVLFTRKNQNHYESMKGISLKNNQN